MDFFIGKDGDKEKEVQDVLMYKNKNVCNVWECYDFFVEIILNKKAKNLFEDIAVWNDFVVF